LLRTEAFRFIIVRYDHYSQVTKLKEDLEKKFPDRPIFSVDARWVDYRTLVDQYYELNRGFYFIENFEVILENPEIYTGFNQRRDKLAMYPNALIVLISSASGELYAGKIMEKMPDLWSFRSLLLDLKSENSALAPTENRDQEFLLVKAEQAASTLGGLTGKDKEKELNRLLERIAKTPETEFGFLITAYEQIAQLYEDLFVFEEAIAYYLKSEKILNEAEDKSKLAAIYNNLASIYDKKDDYDNALEYYLKEEKICLEEGDIAGLAATYYNMGTVLQSRGDWKQGDQLLILAGFIVHKHGMKDILQGIGLALERLMKRYGEQEFIAIGQRIYEERALKGGRKIDE
jgi:tetratricopeptide (TPR) repeat protein